MAPNKPFDTPPIRKAYEGAKEQGNIIQVDYEKYLHFLDDSDLPDEQKMEFIEIIWSILLNFVDLGFGIHPLQKVLEDNFIENPDVNQDTKRDSNRNLAEELRSAAQVHDEPVPEKEES